MDHANFRIQTFPASHEALFSLAYPALFEPFVEPVAIGVVAVGLDVEAKQMAVPA